MHTGIDRERQTYIRDFVYYLPLVGVLISTVAPTIGRVEIDVVYRETYYGTARERNMTEKCFCRGSSTRCLAAVLRRVVPCTLPRSCRSRRKARGVSLIRAQPDQNNEDQPKFMTREEYFYDRFFYHYYYILYYILLLFILRDNIFQRGILFRLQNDSRGLHNVTEPDCASPLNVILFWKKKKSRLGNSIFNLYTILYEQLTAVYSCSYFRCYLYYILSQVMNVKLVCPNFCLFVRIGCFLALACPCSVYTVAN